MSYYDFFFLYSLLCVILHHSLYRIYELDYRHVSLCLHTSMSTFYIFKELGSPFSFKQASKAYSSFFPINFPKYNTAPPYYLPSFFTGYEPGSCLYLISLIHGYSYRYTLSLFFYSRSTLSFAISPRLNPGDFFSAYIIMSEPSSSTTVAPSVAPSSTPTFKFDNVERLKGSSNYVTW